jgi:immune inhibitor A
MRHAATWLLLAALAAGPGRAMPPPAPGAPVGKSARLDLEGALARGLGRPAPRAARLPAHVLVLLVDFPDRPHASDRPPALYDSLFFAPHPSSVRGYYERSSRGRLVISGRVVPWLRLARPYSFYVDAANGGAGVRGPDPRNARSMVADAVRAADPLVDFAAFDADGPDGVAGSHDDDGAVDALVVVHAGSGAEFGDASEMLSHSWYTVAPVRTADGVLAWRYSTVAEDSRLGVLAHEFGHVLGLADLYDRRSRTRLAGGLGDWSLMATGGWLGGGDAPADLDAASKLELGFVDAIVPRANTGGLLLPPDSAATPPDVYCIWTHGRPEREYFVVENRRRQSPEDSLPGSGMLVYHVDLDRADNDDPEYPRVRLLQADGREDIERRVNNGDAGDPFPGATGRLTEATDPDSRARDGHDSQVRLLAISPPTATMTFDLVVDTTPALVAEAVAATELQGDGDGYPEAGERVAVRLLLRNQGLATGALAAHLAARPASDATWIADTAVLASIEPGDTASAVFAMVPRADLPDPYGVALAARFTGSSWQDSTSVRVGLGARAGFLACFGAEPSRFTRDCSDPAEPWTVAVLGRAGSWRLETSAGDLASVWRSASGQRYANDSDVALVSPSFLLVPASTLQLLHSYDTQDLGAGWCADGGRVEISLDGGAWEPLAPAGGWPRRFERASVPQLAGAGGFGGTSPRRWDRFDLGARRGSARLRFRFVADDSLAGSGWEIARVEVGPARAAAPRARVEVVAEPNPVRFPARVSFRITAPLTTGARPTTLHVYDLRGRCVRTLFHAPVPAQAARMVWDGTDDRGRAVASGSYLVRLEWGDVSGATRLVVVR